MRRTRSSRSPGRPLPVAATVAVVLALGVLRATAAGAHALSPSMLVLREGEAGVVDVTWKTPLQRVPGSNVRPVLPLQCAPTTGEDGDVVAEEDSVVARWRVDCGGASVVGMRIGVEGLAGAKTDALLRIERADGRTIDTVLRPRDAFFTVPADEERLDVARRYVRLGIEHIAGGHDHLLFVFGLLLLAVGTRALVGTITAFTVGHSVTLSLAVLGVTRMPPAPVEALIAVSIFVLAVELARETPARTLMRRAPWLIAFLFGLLHGLGFAGTLRAAGLPPSAIPLALVTFNVGIELGQLAFVAAILGARAVVGPAQRRLPTWSRAVPVYAMGVLAAFWVIERSLPLLR
jgi:hypothetical protein